MNIIDPGISATLYDQAKTRQSRDTLALGNLYMNNSGVKPGTQMSAEAADKVAKDFESMFISQMLEQMFGESLGDNMFGDSETDEVYKGLMMQEYGKQITASGGIGIADYVKRELLKLQEV